MQTHTVLLQNTTPTPLGRLRLAAHIASGAGVERTPPLRVYGAYAVVCILRGSGHYHNGQGMRLPIAAGEVIVVFPEHPHWYGPPRGQTWDELYVTFEGSLFDLWRQAGVLHPSRPVHRPSAEWYPALRALVEAAATADRRRMPAARRLRHLIEFQSLLATLLLADGESFGFESETLPDWVAQARGLLEVDLGRTLNLATVAGEVGMSYETFRKQFQKEVGVSPAHYRTLRRIEAAKELLRYSPQITNRQAAETLGFADEYHFSKRFTLLSGTTPRAFRRDTQRNTAMNTFDNPTFLVRRLIEEDFPALRDLRGRILRPGMPPEATVFPEDALPETVHFGAFDNNNRLVGIATLVKNQGWQLRGMATEPFVRGTGAGAAVLREAHRLAEDTGETLWCNARTVAVGFYKKMGWRTEGEEFNVPGIDASGVLWPHYVMRWQG